MDQHLLLAAMYRVERTSRMDWYALIVWNILMFDCRAQ